MSTDNRRILTCFLAGVDALRVSRTNSENDLYSMGRISNFSDFKQPVTFCFAELIPSATPETERWRVAGEGTGRNQPRFYEWVSRENRMGSVVTPAPKRHHSGQLCV
jgi:hypothetical protein